MGAQERLCLFQVEQSTPDVPLPGLKQKGKEAEAIGKAPAQSGPGAADQVFLLFSSHTHTTFAMPTQVYAL